MSNYNKISQPAIAHTVECHQLDVRVRSRFLNRQSKNSGGTRSEIRELSEKSRKRLIFAARNRSHFTGMLTFTFPHEDYAKNATGGDFMQDGEAVKTLLYKLRKWLTYRDYSGLWFLEFQKRGAPHFHVILAESLSPEHTRAIHKYWNKIVGSDCPHHLERGCKVEVLRKKHSAAAYAAKYSSKEDQKTVPDRYGNVGRFWGLFGMPPEEVQTIRVQSLKEIYELARIARNAEKAHRRALNLPNRRKFQHPSIVRYSIASAVRAYLEYRYIILDNPAQIRVTAQHWHNSGFSPPLPEGIAKKYEPRF